MYLQNKFILLPRKDTTNLADLQTIERVIDRLGFGDDAPPTIEIDHVDIEKDKNLIMEEFAELIHFFESESNNTSVIFSSSFAKVNGKILGMGEIFLRVLGFKPVIKKNKSS